MNNRGRTRSLAQRAGTSNAYHHSTSELIDSYNPQHTIDVGRSYMPPVYQYPPQSDVNLLLQSEDFIRAGLFYRAADAYNWRLNPITYMEQQMGGYARLQ